MVSAALPQWLLPPRPLHCRRWSVQLAASAAAFASTHPAFPLLIVVLSGLSYALSGFSYAYPHCPQALRDQDPEGEILCCNFNQDATCVSVGTRTGYSIYNCDPFARCFRDSPGGECQ